VSVPKKLALQGPFERLSSGGYHIFSKVLSIGTHIYIRTLGVRTLTFEDLYTSRLPHFRARLYTKILIRVYTLCTKIPIRVYTLCTNIPTRVYACTPLGHHTLVQDSAGIIWGWGLNAHSQLGPLNLVYPICWTPLPILNTSRYQYAYIRL
jgi:hypothetical protein